MAITKNIEIDGRMVPFKASATVPRLYRLKFGRDIFSDIDKLIEATQGGDAEESALTIESLTIFEDVAYTMAKYADDSVPDTPEEWLDGFNVFSIYFILPQIVELWRLNDQTAVESKKKQGPPTGQ
jgi:hypothetical protein